MHKILSKFPVFVPRGATSFDNSGVGVEKPHEVEKEDDEFDVYRKRMMLAYKFRPNPLVSLLSFAYFRTDFNS